jgi:Flp pilus assembly protein TadD
MKGKRTIRILLWGFIVLTALALVIWYSAPRMLLWNAERAFAANNLDRAEGSLRLLVALNPDHQRAHFLYAKTLRQLGKLPEADVQLGLADKLGLPKELGRREFGLLYAGWQFSYAKGALQQVLKENPDDLEVIRVLANGCLKQRQLSEAVTYFTRWLELRPDEIEPRLARAQIYVDTRQFVDALKDFSEVLKQSPENFRARLGLALSLLSEARVAEAEPELLVCRRLRPDNPEPIIGLAECAMEKGDFLKARTLLGQALDLDPASVLAYRDLGNLNFSQQRYEEAVSNFTQIVRLAPDDRQGHLRLAQALNRLGRKEEAKEHEERYKELENVSLDRLKSVQGGR